MNNFRLIPTTLYAVYTVTLLTVGTSAAGQFSALKGTWINPTMQGIVISDTIRKTSNNYLSTKTHTDSFELHLYGDTLSFQSHYTSSATDYRILYTDRYDYKILQADQYTLELKPVSTFAADFFGSNKSVIVKRQEHTIDHTVRFEKLRFASGLCYGACPDYEYELTNQGAFRLRIKTAFRNGNSFMADSTARGYFVGQVPDSLYRAVIDALQTCYLSLLTIPEVLCCDAPLITLSVHVNGQKRTFKTMFPPVITQKLVAVLRNVYNKSPRRRTNMPFVFE